MSDHDQPENQDPKQPGQDLVPVGDNHNMPAKTGDEPEADAGSEPGTALVLPIRGTEAAPRRGILSRVFNKSTGQMLANMAARSAVTNVVKMGAVGAAVGFGASAFVTSAVAIGAAGLTSAVMSYGFQSWKDYKAAKAAGEEFKFISMSRAKQAALALACGVAGGAIGSWLAHSEIAQSAFRWVASHAGPTIHSWIASASAAFGLHHAAAPAPAAGLAAAPAAPAPSTTVLSRAADMLAAHGDSGTHLGQALAHVNVHDVNSVSPQFLKDSAHEILRMKDLPLADRYAMARALAETARDRGNHQAVAFLKDLTRLEDRLAGRAGAAAEHAASAHHAPHHAAHHHAATKPTVAPAHEATHVAGGAVHVAEMPVADAPSADAPVVDAPAATGDAITPVPAPAPVEVRDLPPLSQHFATQTGTCSVSYAADGSTSSISCNITVPEMQGGDYITFIDASDPTHRVTTSLSEGSVGLSTGDFQNETVISDGVNRLSVLIRSLRR